MRLAVASVVSLLLACSGDGGGGKSGAVDECSLSPAYSLSIGGCPGTSRVTWCTGGRTVDCHYQPSEPLCIQGLCLSDVDLQCEHPPPSASCSGSPCPDELAYRCMGTATIDGCSVFLGASMTENFPGTCP